MSPLIFVLSESVFMAAESGNSKRPDNKRDFSSQWDNWKLASYFIAG
jgi:hypothetical protein